MRLLLLALILAATDAAAQPADPCPEGAAVGLLEGADVRAALFPNGNLFFGPGYDRGDGYVVPTTGEDAGRSPLYAAGLWVGGRVGGEVRASAARYANFVFRPGQAGDDGTPPTPAECAAADRIFVVSRDDVARFLGGAPATDDLRDWPVHLGAPVLDGDGDSTNYDLAGGDQPALRGDVTAFWAMTDTAAPPPFPDYGSLLGVDVTMTASTFRASPAGSSPSVAARLGATTLYRVTVVNRTGATVDSAAVGVFLDWDLGNASDDYVGADTTRAMAFIYNADAFDDGVTGYGVPPAAGLVVLDTPPGADGARLGLTSAMTFVSASGPSTDPFVATSYYHYLLGRWGNGVALQEGGDGYPPQAGPVTTYAYAGDPVTAAYWSERNIDGNGTFNAGNDRRQVAAVGPVTLAPGESAVLTFALVFAQGADHIDSVVRLRGRAEQLHALQSVGVFEPQPVEATTVSPPPAVPLAIRRPSPNPFAGTTALSLRGLAGGSVTLTVTDVLGRVVERRDVTVAADDVDVSLGAALAPGVYVVRVAGRTFSVGFPVVKTR